MNPYKEAWNAFRNYLERKQNLDKRYLLAKMDNILILEFNRYMDEKEQEAQ